MDKSLRNTLRNVVTQCRRLLEDAVSATLESPFGIFKDGEVEDDTRMGHLSPHDRDYRREVLAHLDHLYAGGFKPADAIEQLTREAAFTHLNRLCAYKMMESRGLIREAVSRGVNSNGFKFYLADHDDAERLWSSGQQDKAYQMFLEWLAVERSAEIGVLFSPNDPANRLFPPHRTLTAVLDLINSEELKGIWTGDEAIGWVYQYFTPKEQRDKARKDSQAPRNSYELSFRNQFFTPRYVVEFLTDNTLGRTWYEMQQGQTSLAEQCRYLVRRPDETIPERAKKDPREIRIIDPACGSGHFLLYCFDLLEVIYAEAYDDPDLGPTLHADFLDRTVYLRSVPVLIIENNLHGIDIDLRATQIAALALWLRAQRSYSQLKLKPAERPHIRRSNIVCAEPMPGEADLLDEFASRLSPSALGTLVKKVFEKMKLAGEAGSLLKIEEEIATTVADAKRLWVKDQQAKQQYLPGFDAPLKPTQLEFDFSDMTDDQFWQEAENSVVEALRAYAQSAANGTGFKRRLFADDAERGFAFVDVSRKHYDVALMNPPFGASSTPSKAYIERAYLRTKNDVYAAFVERWLGKLNKGGILGAITSRTGFFLSSFQKWREEILLKDACPKVFADLGGGVLDAAMVETSAYCVVRGEIGTTLFFRLIADDDKAHSLAQSVDALWNGHPLSTTYVFNPESFSRLPGRPFAYWASKKLFDLFDSAQVFEQGDRVARVGLSTSDDFRFLRVFWEIEPTLRASSREDTLGHKRWVIFCKGGLFSPFYSNLSVVLDWADNGEDLKSVFRLKGESPSRNIRSEEMYFLPGLTWPLRATKFAPFILPEGSIFGVRGYAILDRKQNLPNLLGLSNARIFDYLFKLMLGREGYPEFIVGILQQLPIPDLSQDEGNRLGTLSNLYVDLKRSLETVNELSHVFSLPVLLNMPSETLQDSYSAWQNRVADTDQQFSAFQYEIDDIAFKLYGIDGADRDVIEANLASPVLSEDVLIKPDDDDSDSAINSDAKGEIGALLSYLFGAAFGRWDIRYAVRECQLPDLPEPFAPLPVCSPGMLQGEDGLPLRDSPPGYPLDVVWSGVLVDDPQHPDDIIARIHSAFEVIWGDRAEAIEREACEILGVKELREYFRASGKGGFWLDHVARYSKSRRKAPIYWLLQSSKKNYGVWLYYHRLDKDMRYKVLVNYVEPKIRLEESHMLTLRSQRATAGTGGSAVKQLDKTLERQEAFVSELHDFADKLRRAAALHLDPDLNDGVVLNIAPLWELVPWSEAKKYWDELKAGKYEWSSIGKQLREKGIIKG